MAMFVIKATKNHPNNAFAVCVKEDSAVTTINILSLDCLEFK